MSPVGASRTPYGLLNVPSLFSSDFLLVYLINTCKLSSATNKLVSESGNPELIFTDFKYFFDSEITVIVALSFVSDTCKSVKYVSGQRRGKKQKALGNKTGPV